MTISSKLMLIVLLTIFEISLTLWSVFEISNGAKFHQLNLFHLKYATEFSNKVFSLEKDSTIDVVELEKLILDIRQQPIDCLESVNFLNEFIMKQIGTHGAIGICVKDIEDGNRVLLKISEYNDKKISKETFIFELKNAAYAFNESSSLFEKPVTETVLFVMKSMVPLVVGISLFNILFISFMSNTISSSIKSAVDLLKSKNSKESLAEDISKNVSGELKVLLEVAQERIRNEIFVTEINQQLEKLVEQRTESLTRANTELSQFAYRTSHDLKAPLTASKLLTNFIIEDIEAGDIDNAIQDINRIHDQMVKLEDLVMSILSLTEVDSIEVNHSLVNVDNILDDIQQRLFGLVNESEYVVDREIEPDIQFFSCPIRITQILENLISNSLKYRDEKKSELAFIKVSLLGVADNYQLTVEDNGIGIPEDRHKEVFQMFKRFHPQLSFGSGLGLAIVKKHIDYLDGTIQMQTSPGGTKFIITIPKLGEI